MEEASDQSAAPAGFRDLCALGPRDDEKAVRRGADGAQRHDGLGSRRLGERAWRRFAYGPAGYRRVPTGEGRPHGYLLRDDDGADRGGEVLPHSPASPHRLPRTAWIYSPFPCP